MHLLVFSKHHLTLLTRGISIRSMAKYTVVKLCFSSALGRKAWSMSVVKSVNEVGGNRRMML